MDQFIIGWAINTILTLVQIILQGHSMKRQQFKRALLKVRDAINLAYENEEKNCSRFFQRRRNCYGIHYRINNDNRFSIREMLICRWNTILVSIRKQRRHVGVIRKQAISVMLYAAVSIR